MTWFQSFRGEHGFMFYGDQTSPASLDKPLVAVVYLCVLVSGATLLATLGIRGREKWSHAIRASYGVAIASIILVCIASHNWMEGHVQVKAPFVYRSNMHFSGALSLRIGLKSANITLDGIYMSPSGGKQVYFVETLPWPDYGAERLSFWSQCQRGLPGPILRVMDFLTYDSGDLQWGKSFHRAGQFAWALLWTSFVFWILSNLLLFSVVIYGAYMFFLTGVALLMACVAFSQGMNPQPLQMTFGQQLLELEYGWSFWLAIVAGSLTTLLGVVLIVTDIFIHRKVAEFFHLEKVGEEDDFSCKEENNQFINKNGIFKEARGLNPASLSDRRESIFLEPERQTNWVMNPVGGKGNPLRTGLSQHLAKSLDADAKVNPLYGREDVKHWNVYNGDGSPSGLSTRSKSESFISAHRGFQHTNRISNNRKPSLATLKEHRENHANERISNSSKSNLESNSLTRSLNSVCHVRSPKHDRFLYDTAESIRMRSTAGQNSEVVDNADSCNSVETVVEAVVENPPVSDERISSPEVSSTVTTTTKERNDEDDELYLHYEKSFSDEEESRASSCSCGDDAVFNSCNPSRQVSREEESNGVTVVKVRGSDSRQNRNKEPARSDLRQVSIQIEALQ